MTTLMDKPYIPRAAYCAVQHVSAPASALYFTPSAGYLLPNLAYKQKNAVTLTRNNY